MGDQTHDLDREALQTEAVLWQRMAAGDAQARQQLIEHHLPYAKVVAATHFKRRMAEDIEFGDYLQWASLALLESVDRYQPGQGAGFRTFAAHRMRGAILDGLSQWSETRQQFAVRRQLERERLDSVKSLAEPAAWEVSGERSCKELFAYLADVGMGLALGILLEGTGMIDRDVSSQPAETDQPYQHLELKHLKRQVMALARQLPNSQRQVLEQHYLAEVSFSDIALQLGLTKGRISQIHKQALGALRQALLERDKVNLLA